MKRLTRSTTSKGAQLKRGIKSIYKKIVLDPKTAKGKLSKKSANDILLEMRYGHM